jgi:hypothetical protein
MERSDVQDGGEERPFEEVISRKGKKKTSADVTPKSKPSLRHRSAKPPNKVADTNKKSADYTPNAEHSTASAKSTSPKVKSTTVNAVWNMSRLKEHVDPINMLVDSGSDKPVLIDFHVSNPR